VAEDTKDVIRIARVAHEANRALCEAFGDVSQVPWDIAPEWQKLSAVEGVEFALANPDAPASAQHDAWVADKELHGWRFGRSKSAEDKTHPCLIPFEDLSPEQKAKDFIFRAVVAAMSTPRVTEIRG
jgi:hypothetical protein